MRAFNLFAGLVGAVMVLVSLWVVMQANDSEQAHVDSITEKIYAYSAVRISDVVREDAYSTVVAGIRKDFQDFFATHELEPPEEAWEDEKKFREWFEDVFAKSDEVVKWVADRLAYHLRGYGGSPVEGFTLTVNVRGAELEEALKRTIRLVITEEGTFTLVLDMRELTQEEYRALPSLRVCKGTDCYTSSVFPRGVVAIPVPLRVMEAYRHAREAYFKVKEHADELTWMYGVCETGCGGCGLYKWKGLPVRIYPETCNPRITNLGHTYFVVDMMGSGCTAQEVNIDGELVPCTPSHARIFLMDRLEENVEEITGLDVTIKESSFVSYAVAPVLRQTAINMGRVFTSQMLPFVSDIILKYLPEGWRTGAVLAVDRCEYGGEVYCTVPSSLSYTVKWVDPDVNFSTKGENAVFLFSQRVKEPFNDIMEYYRALDDKTRATHFQPSDEYVSIDCDSFFADSCFGSYLAVLKACGEVGSAEAQVIDDALKEGNLLKACVIDDEYVAAYCTGKDAFLNVYSSMVSKVRSILNAKKDNEICQAASLPFTENGMCSRKEKMCTDSSLSRLFPKCPEAKGVVYSTTWMDLPEEVALSCCAGEQCYGDEE